MKIIKCLALSAGLAALAACGTADDPADNVDANLMVEDNLTMPPADMNMDMNLGNDMNNVTDNMGNVTDNMTNNTVNAY